MIPAPDTTVVSPWKDTGLKVFWTVLSMVVGILAAEAAELAPGYAVLIAAVANVIAAEIRKRAGKYAPPEAEAAKSVLPETRAA